MSRFIIAFACAVAMFAAPAVNAKVVPFDDYSYDYSYDDYSFAGFDDYIIEEDGHDEYVEMPCEEKPANQPKASPQDFTPGAWGEVGAVCVVSD